MQQEEETLMIMKTKISLYKRGEEEIKKIHKYEVPEIICLPLKDGSSEYLNWIDEQTES